jgi:sugar porter (SP) family MFS transporter
MYSGNLFYIEIYTKRYHHIQNGKLVLNKIGNRYVNKLAVIASLGGFLFGYDTAVISGTINFVVPQFHLDATGTGWFVSSALVGCIVGVSVAGVLSDKYGRKKILILSALFFGVSALGCTFSFGFKDLVTYRVIGGLGIGVASMLSPLYISELSPSYKRGRLVALYQLAIAVGILCSYFSNAFLLKLSQTTDFTQTIGFVHKLMVSEVWRMMLGTSVIPALLFLFLLFFVPESPRWLIKMNDEASALAVLKRIVTQQEAQLEISDIKLNLQRELGGWVILFKGKFRMATIIGVSLAFLTQVSGINAIIYYGPKILQEAGLPIGDAFGSQVLIGVVIVLFTLIALWKIDQLGRKPLLLIGIIGILISLLMIGALFYLNISSNLLLLIFILIFIACFAFSYGPVIWVLLSEIFPTKVRGKAMSLATLSLWIGTALVGQLTPLFLEKLKPAGTFWLFAVMTAPALWLTIKIIPETKGKTLEEIERYWLDKK